MKRRGRKRELPGQMRFVWLAVLGALDFEGREAALDRYFAAVAAGEPAEVRRRLLAEARWR